MRTQEEEVRGQEESLPPSPYVEALGLRRSFPRALVPLPSPFPPSLSTLALSGSALAQNTAADQPKTTVLIRTPPRPLQEPPRPPSLPSPNHPPPPLSAHLSGRFYIVSSSAVLRQGRGASAGEGLQTRIGHVPLSSLSSHLSVSSYSYSSLQLLSNRIGFHLGG